MSNLSIRGLDERALTALKRRASAEDVSVNNVVVRLIEQAVGHRRAKATLQRHSDLDELAGSWSKREGDAFERATAPFQEIDPTLWK